MRRLILSFLFAVLAGSALGETDYPSKPEFKALTRRVEALEDGPTVRVKPTPGSVLWTNIPGYRVLEFVPVGGVVLSGYGISNGVARVSVASSTAAAGLSSVTATNGVLGRGTVSDPLHLDLSYIPDSDTKTVGYTGPGLDGDGSVSNPLAVDEDAVVVSTGRLDQAYLMWDEASGEFVSYYGPRRSISEVQAAEAWTSGALTNILPGQLLRLTLGAYAGNTYECTNAIDLAPWISTTNLSWLPEGSNGAAYWAKFVDRGAAGLNGSDGATGPAGIGGVLIGPWIQNYNYVYATNAVPLVVYDGRIYAMTNTASPSSNQVPPSYPGTWYIAVDRGESGVISGASNTIHRGTWSISGAYTTNDIVSYWGNEFYVDPTNQLPPLAAPPSLSNGYYGVDSPYWTVYAGRGPQGVQGVAGTNSVTVYRTYDIYQLMTNLTSITDGSVPTNSLPLLVWDRFENGTNFFKFSGAVPAGTNSLSVTNVVLYINGNAYSNWNGQMTALGVGLGEAYPGTAGAAVSGRVVQAESNLTGLGTSFSNWTAGADGFANISTVRVSGGVAYIDLNSNSLWYLQMSNQPLSSWSITPSNTSFLIGVVTAPSTNQWVWPLYSVGVTNPPATNRTDLFTFTYEPPGMTSILVK